MKYRYLLIASCAALFLTLSAFAPVAAQSRPFEPVVKGRLASTPDVAALAASAKRALLHFGWRIDQDEPGKISATFTKDGGKVSATIALSYSSAGYEIAYVDSKNLDVDLKAKTIHRNYVRWIANLDKSIAEGYQNP